MGDDFYAAIKLISGEEIVASVCIDETDDEPIIIAHSPVTMKMLNGGAFVKIKSWMEMSDDDMFIIRPDKIITMTEIKDMKIITIYEKYMSDDNAGAIDVNRLQNQGKVRVSNKMGYISSVEESRKKLEELFKNTQDKKES